MGQKVKVRAIATPDRVFCARVKHIGGTTGAPWERSFDCRNSLDDTHPALRQGMTVVLEIFTGEERNDLWIPSQALFESDGRTFVYLQEKDSVAGGGFSGIGDHR